jgi:imidazolonepropionase-like amidohydrolase
MSPVPTLLGRALVAGTLALAAAAAGEHPFETDALREPTLATGGSCVIRNVTIHSAVGPAFLGDVLVRDGRIAAVGDVGDAGGALEVDGSGKHLAPGVIDCHSHTAISGGVNEGTESITVDVDISDTVDPDDPAIYRALAGGVTVARLLHGSANAIGGRHEVIKLRRGRTRMSELVLAGAPEGVKFALGENPKRSNYGRGAERFPDTRMGVEAIFQRAFERAREYAALWQAYRAAVERGEDPEPPRRDIRLDGLVGILDGSIEVHSHCYRADEILMLLRTAERFGFRVKTLQHVLEGYKVAHEIAEHGAGPSAFADWWAYKIEAYEAIPFNAALLDEAGAVTSLNSDSDELMRRLFADAAKAVRYGGMDPVRALRLVTLNPAVQLGIDDRVGSIESGKDADLVLLTGDPLSALSRVELTLVDGEVEFQRRDAFGLESDPPPVTPLSEPRAAVAPPPSAGRAGTIALVGGRIHPVTAPVIEGGTLLLEDGLIAAVGKDLEIPAGARVVDCAGLDVWPGMIALDTNLGLFEIGSVAGTVDVAEGGGNQPDLRASASINADSAHIAVTRFNGVTRAQTAPQGGGPLRGQSCVIRLTGQTWEEMLTIDRDMLHLSFPRRGNDLEPGEAEEPSEAVEELARVFEQAREYARLVAEAGALGAPAPPYDPRLEALAPFARGEKRIAVHATNAQTILDALRFVAEQGLDAVLYDVGEGWKVVDAIARSGLPCVVGPVLALPRSRYDPYDAAYANAAVLARAGVPLAISPGNDENPRNVAFHAAMAVAFGLPHEEGVRAVTYYAARALGLEDRLGSLAPGKLADVVVTEGDLLEPAAPVRQVFIDGVQQPMRSMQTELYQRYRERLHRLQASGTDAR